ncbi:MAG: hypothetical protein V4621_07805 [Pseudomonadota bacterium]
MINTYPNRKRLIQAATICNVLFWMLIAAGVPAVALVLLVLNCIPLCLYFWLRLQPEQTKWDREIEIEKRKTANPIKDN